MSPPRNSPPSFSAQRRWDSMLNAVIGVFAVLALVVMANYLAQRHFQRWFPSKRAALQLSPQTLGLLRTLRRVFHSKLHVRQGKLEVTVISAVTLSDLQCRHVQQALADALNAEPVLTCRVDPDLLGGVVVQVGDHVYDASIRAELRSVQTRLRRDIHLELPKLASQAEAGKQR